MYGWRGRIGLMVPTGNSCMEPEFNRLSPEGVSVHANRVYLKDVTPDSLIDMTDEAKTSAQGLVGIRVDCLAFGCTSGSFVGGPGHDKKLIAIIEDATGVAATTTTTAVIRAFAILGVSRVALVTPYIDAVNEIEIDFLRQSGIEVTGCRGGGLTETADIQALPPEVSYRRAREADSAAAEAVFISCTGFRTIENLAALEADLGKPVISSNQATFADCLRLMGVRDVRPGFGGLFDKTFAASTP